MEHIWAFLVQTLTASVTAVILLLAKRLFLDKLSPRWQYGIWAILALRVLLPAGLWGRSLFPGLDLALEAAKTAAESRLSSALTGPWETLRVLAPVPLFPRDLPAPASVTDLLFYLYAAGAAAALLWFFLSYLRLRRRVVRGEAPSPQVMAQLEAVAARYALKLPPRVAVLPGVESAFVCGPIRPVLVLPRRDVDDKVLLHELLHLKYGDLWAGVGICLLRCLHWCNPLLWYCWDRAQNDSEALCDQRVLERLEGEERREYGVILLSMAEDQYARSPGTTSMANGGQNIKARIQAIARFKRYPQGVALGSWCVAVVLGAACLWGTAGAAAVPEAEEAGGPLVLAQAMDNRPTTVAGALDTYAKAVLCDSPLYYAMVSPPEERSGAWEAALEPYREVELEDAPFNDLGYRWHRPAWQAEWSVMDLRSDGAGGWTGVLIFQPLEWDDTLGTVYQPVAVAPDGAFWTVEPLGELAVQASYDGEPVWLCPSTQTPYTTYTAECAGLRVEVDVQLQLAVNSAVSADTSGLLSWSSTFLDPVPQPHSSFNRMRNGFGLRVTRADTGEAVELPVELALTDRPGDPEEALAGASYQYAVAPGTLDMDPVMEATGVYDGENMDLTAMPAALALKFTYNGREHICTALPTEVTP